MKCVGLISHQWEFEQLLSTWYRVISKQEGSLACGNGQEAGRDEEPRCTGDVAVCEPHIGPQSLSSLHKLGAAIR